MPESKKLFENTEERNYVLTLSRWFLIFVLLGR